MMDVSEILIQRVFCWLEDLLRQIVNSWFSRSNFKFICWGWVVEVFFIIKYVFDWLRDVFCIFNDIIFL